MLAYNRSQEMSRFVIYFDSGTSWS